MTPACVTIEFDTTPPEPIGSLVPLAVTGAPYEVDMEFDQLLDSQASVRIVDSDGVAFPANDAVVDGASLRASVSLLGAAFGAGTLILDIQDDVWNAKAHEFPLTIAGGVSVLMEVPERDFGFYLPIRGYDYELPERAFEFELPELD